MRCSILLVSCLLLSLFASSTARAQPPADPTPAAELVEEKKAVAEKQEGDSKAPNREQLYRRFTESMTQVKLVGKFTVTGQQQKDLPSEEYEIRGVQKLPNGDFWLITARIKYGDHDVTVPIPLEVKWAGDTPVITLTDLTIPGLGTFSSRVVLHEGKYAGTWRHGEAGGHLFGTIEKLEAAPQP